MAVTIDAAAAIQPLNATFQSVTGDDAIKRTLINGAADDTDLIAYMDNLDTLSNALIFNAKFGGREFHGMKGAAVNASQNLVSAFMQLNFTQVDPINAAKTIEKAWRLPAFIEACRGSDNTPVIAAAGTGSTAARIGAVVAFLVDNLCGVDASGAPIVGGWTYAGGGFGTGADFVDGE